MHEVAHAYQELDAAVKDWGSPLRAPFMTLSFMALLVIPELKLSDQGLFDGGRSSSRRCSMRTAGDEGDRFPSSAWEPTSRSSAS